MPLEKKISILAVLIVQTLVAEVVDEVDVFMKEYVLSKLKNID
jgi:uncharacterized membrane protein